MYITTLCNFEKIVHNKRKNIIIMILIENKIYIVLDELYNDVLSKYIFRF